MMLGRTMETRLVAGVVLDDPLAERLGEGVAVGPAEAAGALGADPDQLVLDPLLAGGLGGVRGGEQAGPAVLLLGLLAVPGERVGAARLGARPARAGPGPTRSRPRGRRRASTGPSGMLPRRRPATYAVEMCT